MDASTLALLDLAIAHWTRLATGTAAPGEIPFSSDCALCGEFFEREGPDQDCCFGCPVSAKTGHSGCEKTPWRAAASIFREESKASQNFQKAADCMLQFLVTLRKELSDAQ